MSARALTATEEQGNENRRVEHDIHWPINGRLDCSSTETNNGRGTQTQRTDNVIASDSTHQTDHNPTSTQAPGEDWHSSVRKRRRISPPISRPPPHDGENEVASIETTANKPTTSWLDQLRQAAEPHPKGPEILDNRAARAYATSVAFDAPDGDKENSSDKDHVRSREDENFPPTVLSSPRTPRESTTLIRKMLKLNSNGKLLSSPTGTKSQGHHGARNSIVQGTNGLIDTSANLIVILKYGKDEKSRSEIGKKIDLVLQGDAAASPTLSTAVSPVGTKPGKPTHPFFLSQSIPKSTSAVNGKELIEGPSTSDYASNSLPRKGLHSVSDGSKDNKRTVSTTLSSSRNIRELRGRGDRHSNAIWPPKEMVHLTGDSRTSTTLSTPLSVRKSKGMLSNVDAQEGVLFLIKTRLQSLFHHTDIDKFETQMRPRMPPKLVCSGQDIHDKILNGHDLGDKLRLSRNISHPAKIRLMNRSATAMSAFDLWQCENYSWCSKYAPNFADDVLQSGFEAVLLRDWLKSLRVSAVNDNSHLTTLNNPSGKRTADGKKKKKRKRADDLDGFLVSSEDEDQEMAPFEVFDNELASTSIQGSSSSVMKVRGVDFGSSTPKSQVGNCILISGPHGCGKTASVYAAAKELGFEVFEINSSSRRGGKEIFDRVGDVTQNHLVQKAAQTGPSSNAQDGDNGATVQEEIASGKQGTMRNFFGPGIKRSRRPLKPTKPRDDNGPVEKERNHHKQSLILFEEVDVLYEDDRTFWSGVQAIIQQSKRPVVLTCTDESLVPLSDLYLQGILRYTPPTRDAALDYLLLLALDEGHCLDRSDVAALYDAKRGDLRATITALDFWCQMAVGSQEGGLDWMIERYPPGKDLDFHGRPLRTISFETFTVDLLNGSSHNFSQSAGLSWLERQEVASLETIDIPNSMITHFVERSLPPEKVTPESYSSLAQFGDLCDARSNLDLLLADCEEDFLRDIMDPTCPPLSTAQRSNYTEGYPLIHASVLVDYTKTMSAIGAVYGLQIHRVCSRESAKDAFPITQNEIQPFSHSTPSAKAHDFAKVFEPLQNEDKPTFPPATGWLAPSLDRNIHILAADIAPAIRSIVSFDIRLEQQREQLSQASTEARDGGKRARTTRASRAALEGGDKASTRRARWFPKDLDYRRVLETGGLGWQDVALRYTCAVPEASVDMGR